MAFLWLINGGDPKYLLSGMILQVVVAAFKLISKKSDQQDLLNGHRKNLSIKKRFVLQLTERGPLVRSHSILDGSFPMGNWVNFPAYSII